MYALDRRRVAIDRREDEPLRGLVWCGSTRNDKQGSLVKRDVNAALNILKCAKSETRPIIFDRQQAKERLPDWMVGKVLKPVVH